MAAKEVAENFAKTTGHRLTFTVGQPATIESDLDAGAKADVVILPSPVVAMLGGTGALRAGSAVDLARVGIGVVVRNGASAPDISNAAAIRKLLTRRALDRLSRSDLGRRLGGTRHRPHDR